MTSVLNGPFAYLESRIQQKQGQSGFQISPGAVLDALNRGEQGQVDAGHSANDAAVPDLVSSEWGVLGVFLPVVAVDRRRLVND